MIFLFYFFNNNVCTFLALQCLAFLVYGNSTVASLVVDSALEDGQTLVESVASLMDRNKKIEMQLAAARVVCYLNRYVNILKSFVKLIQKILQFHEFVTKF